MLDVNYRGSAGYGKAYRESLHLKWGIYDVEDAISGSQHLVDNGLAHPQRLVIMGGSAGGYTVLRALTTKPGFFKAGICLYGIANLFTLAAATHKFESHYLDALVGHYPKKANSIGNDHRYFQLTRFAIPSRFFKGRKTGSFPKIRQNQW